MNLPGSKKTPLCLDGQVVLSRRAPRRSSRSVPALLAAALIVLSASLLIADRETILAEASSPEILTITGNEPALGAQARVGTVELTDSQHKPSSELLGPGQPAQRGAPLVSRTYPLPPLERADLTMERSEGMPSVRLSELPEFATQMGGRHAGLTPRGEVVFYSLHTELQALAQRLVNASRSPHVALVAMEPRTGRVLAIADKSSSFRHLALHTGFPAASLFKVVTAAAAVEHALLNDDTLIKFRGSTYTLERWNYLPDAKRDRKSLALGPALGMSCNPVFGRVALNYLTAPILERYARLFGFNSNLRFDAPLAPSRAYIPTDDYGLSRTAAGFGEVKISAVHAAAFMAGLANGGLLTRPSLIDSVVDQDGRALYEAKPQMLKRIVQPDTAREVLKMMQHTTITGTSRAEFMRKGKPVMPGVPVAAKTGTLRGDDPKGLNTWFIAAAPMGAPEIAIAAIVVNPTIGSKASHLGKLLIESYLKNEFTATLSIPQPAIKSKKSAKSYAKPASKKRVVYSKPAKTVKKKK